MILKLDFLIISFLIFIFMFNAEDILSQESNEDSGEDFLGMYLGLNSSYLFRAPKGECFTFKIKLDPFFRIYLGTVANRTFKKSIYAYLGYIYHSHDLPEKQFSGIYDYTSGKYVVDNVKTPNLLNSGKYTNFWVTWHENLLKIGIDCKIKPLIEYRLDVNRKNMYLKIEPIGQTAVLQIGNSFVCPKPNTKKETMVQLGSPGSYIIPAPVTNCLSFKIKSVSFNLYFGQVTENYDFQEHFGVNVHGINGKFEDLTMQKNSTFRMPIVLNDKNFSEYWVTWHNNEFKLGIINFPYASSIEHKFIGNLDNYFINISSSLGKADLVILNHNFNCGSGIINPSQLPFIRRRTGAVFFQNN